MTCIYDRDEQCFELCENCPRRKAEGDDDE